MSHISIIVGENIRGIRQSKGLSQERLALRAGINPSFLGQIERAEKSPTIVSLEKLAIALGVKVEELFHSSTDEIQKTNATFLDKIIFELSERTNEEQEDIYKIIIQLLVFKDKKEK
ncbi:helix-turn-helix domain-containing protein [Paenibacillus sp. p3-SID867]|uniref:helix-turn-helix domain-containing protein n=1 Tax=Paenibacillus sp. p3-SID867 TaxID=2916363 RepID=UPI0021A6B083|nr:helix-turn-helix transcriptional regulator [Paenibacillus sp. p3-SID867]MCT1400046.1 helix-turn-helix domain-containing protein [Paenibacillus sp. p3-SID867]